jgi:hypothetical protein
MAEAGGLNPLQHGFESHRGHCIGLPRSPSSLCLMARFARCDVRRGAAVFVGSDETIVRESALFWIRFVGSPADRRREHRGRGSRFVAAYFVVSRRRKACRLVPLQHGGARFEFDCSARCARSARIALCSRLLRRRSPTKSVSARSSSARRRAIRGPELPPAPADPSQVPNCHGRLST